MSDDFIDLTKLPRYREGGNYINWEASVGHKVDFRYRDIEGNFKIVEYDKEQRKLNILYLKTSHILRIRAIKDLSLPFLNQVRNPNNNFKIGETVNSITLLDFFKDKGVKYYKYSCSKCQNIDKITESNLKRGVSCNACGPTRKKICIGVNDIPTTAPWMVKYFQGGVEEAKLYVRSSGKKIYFKCISCGKIKNKAMPIYTLYTTRSIACDCSSGISYNERFMSNLLTKLNMRYIREYSPSWAKIEINGKIRKVRYDFYFELNNKKYIIEMDGLWHKTDNNLNGLLAKDSILIDNLKDELAKQKSIKVIRVDCTDKNLIEKIINSDLNKLFDLTRINFDLIELESELSNVRNICKDFNGNNINDLSSKYNIHSATVIRYLKKFKTFCNETYTPKNFNKTVEVFCDDEKISEYSSGIVCSKIYGISKSHISYLILNQKQYKGLTFKYKEQT